VKSQLAPIALLTILAVTDAGSLGAMKIEPPPLPTDRGALHSTAPGSRFEEGSLRQGAFNVNLVITESRGGLRKWLAMSNSERDRFAIKQKFRPDQKGYLVLVLTNYDLARDGNVDLTAQLTLIGPDGTVVYEHRDLGKSAWGHPMQGYLAIKPEVDFSFDANDRAGIYTCRVTVSDNLRGEVVSAEGKVLLVK